MEIIRVIKHPHSNKAAGEDLTTAKQCKHPSEDTLQKVTYFIKIIYESGIILADIYKYKAPSKKKKAPRSN